MTPLLLALIFSRRPKAPMPFIIKPVAKAASENNLTANVQRSPSATQDKLVKLFSRDT